MLHSNNRIAVFHRFFFSVKNLSQTPLLNLAQLVYKCCWKQNNCLNLFLIGMLKKSAPNLVYSGRNVRSKLKMA